MILKKIWSHIRIRRRKQLGLLMILMLLASVSEVISIGAILPFLGVLSNPTIIFEHELVQPIIQLLELTEPGQLILPFTILFSLSAIITGSMRILLIWAQTRLANAIGADFSYQIYKRTLFQPYPVHEQDTAGRVFFCKFGS